MYSIHHRVPSVRQAVSPHSVSYHGGQLYDATPDISNTTHSQGSLFAGSLDGELDIIIPVLKYRFLRTL